MTDCILILVTTGSETEAETIGKALVEERLVACVNIVSPIRSIYRWEGEVADRGAVSVSAGSAGEVIGPRPTPGRRD